LTTSYYRGTHCCVLVFDITNQESFYHLYQWIDQYNYYCEFPVKNIVIVGNKHDLDKDRKVSDLEIRQFAESMGCVYVPCSVLSDHGIEPLIDTIIQKSIELEQQLSG
jgi:GTPase SAR1 family protein